MITVLAGGVGGSKFLHGFSLLDMKNVAGIINTGDDIERFGLHVSPDIDINIYRLANVIHEQGWGFKDDTYQVQDILQNIYENECWFNLGDKDLATHINRTHLLNQGYTLAEVTKIMCSKFNISLNILPMSNQKVETYIQTDSGKFHFQEYLIKRRMQDRLISIDLQGIEEASPPPEALDIIRNSSIIAIAPSNPLVSIGPILSVKGIRQAIMDSEAKVVAVSPIINGNVLKGPLAKMMKELNLEVSPIGLAKLYDGLLDGIIIDLKDEENTSKLEDLGLKVLRTNILLDSDSKKMNLIRELLQFIEKIS